MAHALAGRTAVVTGASRGIGLACAQQLIEAGARVALLARGSAELQRQARALGGSAVALDCDVTRPDDVATAVRAVHEQFGAEPDILVNNAGYFALASAERTSPEMFARTVGVNLVAPFQFVHALLPGMKARGSG
ncbi:MAG TPA: SDR family oxidoreductase, partial [Gemmatimonadaceae bacterium]|nr:SDR family oxidoreductase [Gemmatimonadaceae bacterium]